MSLVSKLKKGIIVLSIPLVMACSGSKINFTTTPDDMYSGIDKTRIKKTSYVIEPVEASPYSPRNQNPEYTARQINLEDKVTSDDGAYYTYNYSNPKYNKYNSSSIWDSDGDGINDWNDPWPYRYGPYVDTNLNGRVDYGDIRVGGFGNSYAGSIYFGSNYYNGFGYYGGYSPFSYGYYGGGYYSNSYSYGYYSPYSYGYYQHNNNDNNHHVVYGKRPSRSTIVSHPDNNNRSRSDSNNQDVYYDRNRSRDTNNSGRTFTPNTQGNDFNRGRTRSFDNNQNNSRQHFTPSTPNRTFTPSNNPSRSPSSAPTRRRN